MNSKSIVPYAILIFIASSGTGFAARPFPSSAYDSLRHRSVFIFMDQLSSSLGEKESRFAAEHYLGTQKLTRQAIDRIRKYNENFLHLHYKLAITVDSIADYGMILNGNWHSDNRDSVSNWVQVRGHADWFLLNDQQQWTVHGGRRIVMDISNAGFRDWWVNSCIGEMAANGCDGVFADTYTLAAVTGRTTYPALFNDVERMISEWIPKLNDYGHYVYARLDSAGYYFFPNIDNLQTTWANNAGTHYSKGEYIHGGMMESWGNWASANDATVGMGKALEIQKKGCFLQVQGYINSGGDMNQSLTAAQKRMWMTGTYLLTNNGRMYLSVYDGASADLGASGKCLWFPEWELDLGAFKSEVSLLTPLLWQGVFRRDYEKGFVLVNFDNSRNVALDSACYLAEDSGTTNHYWADPVTGKESVSLKYTRVSSVSMPPFSAAVLLYEEPQETGCLMPLKGDYNGNGRLDILDLIKWLTLYKNHSDDPCADYNNDSVLSIFDLLALLKDLAG